MRILGDYSAASTIDKSFCTVFDSHLVHALRSIILVEEVQIVCLCDNLSVEWQL
jgi:hypothetical protein